MEIGTGKKKMGLSTQIFIALLAGAICGVCVHYFLKEGYFGSVKNVGVEDTPRISEPLSFFEKTLFSSAPTGVSHR